MIFKHTAVYLLLLSVAAPAWAQSAGAKKEPLIEFRAVAWNRDVPGLFYELKGKDQPLPLRRDNITQPQLYDGPPRLVLYLPGMVGDKPVKEPIAEVSLNLPPKKNLIVVWLDKSGRYGATVLADEPTRPAPGQVRFVNLSGHILALNCNGQTQVFPVGAEQIVSAQKGGVGIKVAVEVESDGRWKLALMSGLPVAPTERVTAFIADPGRLALSPEEEEKMLKVKPLSLFVIRDTTATP